MNYMYSIRKDKKPPVLSPKQKFKLAFAFFRQINWAASFLSVNMKWEIGTDLSCTIGINKKAEDSGLFDQAFSAGSIIFKRKKIEKRKVMPNKLK